MSSNDQAHIRSSIELAAESRSNGNHPFGALLVDESGSVVATAQNTVTTESDVTGHAETNLVRIASKTLSTDVLESSTLYTSTEPCAMCSGAIYWAGIPKVVFGLSEEALAIMTGADPENLTMSLTAETVLNSGQRVVEVVGPVLPEEAAVVHEGFWNDPSETE